MTSSPAAPTETLLDRWSDDGFVVDRAVLSRDDLGLLRAEADRLCAKIAADYERLSRGRYVPFEDEAEGYELAGASSVRGSRQLRMIEPLVDLSDAFAGLALRADVTATARAILGGDVALFEDKLNLKLPGGAGFVWHQDWSCCWRAHTDELVTAFIYLDDSTEENGCLKVLPGSHRGKPVRPFVEGSKYTVALDPDEEQRVVPLPLEAGDMITFDPYLVHSSEPNRSPHPRRAIIFTYNPARLGDLWSIRYPELSGRAG